MRPEKLDHYRAQLNKFGRRTQAAVRSLEEAARAPTGGQAAGNLSNAPMHLADTGTEVYTQELNSTLLENEQYLQAEVAAALGRLDVGTFGRCERCRREIPEGRLDALPYARYCVPCSEKLDAGADVNLNAGRPEGWGSTLEHPAKLVNLRRDGEQSPTTAPRVDSSGSAEDPHAAGTPGGGTAVGGLAGTNTGEGDPDNEDLEDAMGSGNFDAAADADEAGAEDGYAGHSGGAVGGTPANKRAVGGHTEGGINPATDRATRP